MPPSTRGRSRDQVCYVPVTMVGATPKLLYGFKTKDIAALSGVSSADLTTQLGHIYGTNGVFTFPAGTIPIFGANAPKPPRVTKALSGTTATPTPTEGEPAPAPAPATGKSISTFCGVDKVVSARNGGWNLSGQGRGITVRGKNTSLSQCTVLIEIPGNGIYAYRLNKTDFDTYQTALGLRTLGDGETGLNETERASIYFGASAPKPGKASIKTVVNGRTSTFSTFYPPAQANALASAGWALTQGVPGMNPAPAPAPAPAPSPTP